MASPCPSYPAPSAGGASSSSSSGRAAALLRHLLIVVVVLLLLLLGGPDQASAFAPPVPLLGLVPTDPAPPRPEERFSRPRLGGESLPPLAATSGDDDDEDDDYDDAKEAPPPPPPPPTPWYETLRRDLSRAAREGFGTRARNVASTLSVGDVVVPLCSDLDLRQSLADRGVYAGVEYVVCSLRVAGEGGDDDDDDDDDEVRSLDGLSREDLDGAAALIRPAYPLRDRLERTDWPVEVRPLEDVPLWLSRATYEAGTALGTVALAGTYLTIASVLALLVRFAYVPTESMIPAVRPGDVVLVSRSVPVGPLRPRAGDVVFFDPPPELDRAVAESSVGRSGGAVPTRGKQFLKRVVAVPGESVGVRDSEPYVPIGPSSSPSSSSSSPSSSSSSSPSSYGGRARVDIVGPYARPDVFPPESWDRPPTPLSGGEYFVAGDNGPRSVDSRVWGPLRERYIFGTARFIVYPPEHFGPVGPGNFLEVNMGD